MNVDVGMFSNRGLKEFLFYSFNFLSLEVTWVKSLNKVVKVQDSPGKLEWTYQGILSSLKDQFEVRDHEFVIQFLVVFVARINANKADVW